MTSETLTLPVLPLRSGVMLPGMVFTIGLETEEARAAADVVGSSGGQLLLVPHIDGKYGSVGVVAEVVERGELPGGLPALIVSGQHRATLGTGVPGTGAALWVEAEPVQEASSDEARTVELAREYRAVLENILLSRGAGRIAAQLREVTEPGRLADLSGLLARPVPGSEGPGARDHRRDRAAVARARVGKDTLADLALRERIKSDVEEGMEKTQREFLLRRQLEAIRKELAELGGGRGGRARRLPQPRSPSATCPKRCARRSSARSTSSSARASRAPSTAGSARGSTPCSSSPGGSSPRTAWTWPRRRAILDEDHDGLDDVKERILEHLAVRKLQAERGLAPVDGRGAGAILALVGPPGRRQDLARRVGRPRARTARSCGSPWAAFATRPRSAATAAPTSGHSRAGSCGRSARPGR